MVGPTVSDEDRRTFLRRLRIGFALLVGASMGLVAIYGDAGPAAVAAALAGGTAIGGALSLYVIPGSVGTSERAP